MIISDHQTVLGKALEDHDLSRIEGGLCSHGGLAEQEVPFMLNTPLTMLYQQRVSPDLRNFDLFDFALNGTAVL